MCDFIKICYGCKNEFGLANGVIPNISTYCMHIICDDCWNNFICCPYCNCLPQNLMHVDLYKQQKGISDLDLFIQINSTSQYIKDKNNKLKRKREKEEEIKKTKEKIEKIINLKMKYDVSFKTLDVFPYIDTKNKKIKYMIVKKQNKIK